MNQKQITHPSKFLPKHLRHEPEAIGIVLQPGGWVPVEDLMSACVGAGSPVSRA